MNQSIAKIENFNHFSLLVDERPFFDVLFLLVCRYQYRFFTGVLVDN